jgi:hypothetical protein
MEMGWRGYQNRSYEGVSFEIERAAVAAQDLLGEGTAGTLCEYTAQTPCGT